MKTRYLEDKLTKHRITPRDADFVLRSELSIWEDLGVSERGNERIMFIGFDFTGRLLEVGVEYFDEEEVELIFHANDATPMYRRLFERMRKCITKKQQ